MENALLHGNMSHVHSKRVAEALLREHGFAILNMSVCKKGMEISKQRTKGRTCSGHTWLLASVLIGLAWLVWSSQSVLPSTIKLQPASVHFVSSDHVSNLEEVELKDFPLQDDRLSMLSSQKYPPPVTNLRRRVVVNESAQHSRFEMSTNLDHHSEYVGQMLPSATFKMQGFWPMRTEPYHNQNVFRDDFRKMLFNFKIFVYPRMHNDPFRNVFAPMDSEPTGNYASESYFKKALLNSNFTTSNVTEANMFFLPFSISRLRHEKRVGVHKLDKFITSYIENIKEKWPYWNRTAGADHFFVSCHSVTKVVSDKVTYLRTNAIQVVCSSNSFLQGYVPHKDISIPQIWPRKGTPPEAKLIKQRKVLAFFAGAANSPVRAAVVKAWSHDQEILVYSKRLSTPYSKALLTSKFCLHIKGYEVNTARIADAMHFGCVPVILANYYDLPFANILDWEQFSLVVETSDIPRLKDILQGVTPTHYERLQKNVMKVRKHFQWNSPAREFDAFYMIMYELWSRRHVLKPSF